MLQDYIEAGADINYSTCNNEPVLVMAVAKNYDNDENKAKSYTEIAKYLIKSGANVEETEDFSSLLLWTMFNRGENSQVDIAEELLKAGANISNDIVKKLVDNYDKKVTFFNPFANPNRRETQPNKENITTIVRAERPEVTMQFVNYAQSIDNQVVLHDIATIANTNKKKEGINNYPVLQKEVMNRSRKGR